MTQFGMTFEQHLIDLAEAVGVNSYDSNGLAALPDDAYELDKLKRRFNDGLRLMAMAKPEGWNCLRQIVTVTIGTDTNAANVIDGDISQYRLPAYVSGQPFGEWSWVLPSGALQGRLGSVTWGEVTRKLNVMVGGSIPEEVAIRPLTEERPGTTDRVGWAIRVYPRPNQIYELSAPFTLPIRPLVDLAERCPFGAVHDPTAQAAAKWSWVKNDTTEARYVQWKIDFMGDGSPDSVGLLGESLRIDAESTPHQVASLLDAVTGDGVFFRLPQQMQINGAAVGI